MSLVDTYTLRQRHVFLSDVEELVGWAALRQVTFPPETIEALAAAKATIETPDPSWLTKTLTVVSEVSRVLGEAGKHKVEEIEARRKIIFSPFRKYVSGPTVLYLGALVTVVILAFLSMLVTSQAFLLDSARKALVEAERLEADAKILQAKDKEKLSDDEKLRLARFPNRFEALAWENFELTISMCVHSEYWLVRELAVSNGPAVKCDPESIKERKGVFTRAVLVSDRVARMANFAIPVLAGFLGALVLVIRLRLGDALSIAYQVVPQTTWLRLILGALCGLAIGWFIQPSGSSPLSTNGDSASSGPGAQWSLAPFALAFLAGYSVEIVFGILDRVSVALVGPSKSDK